MFLYISYYYIDEYRPIVVVIAAAAVYSSCRLPLGCELQDRDRNYQASCTLSCSNQYQTSLEILTAGGNYELQQRRVSRCDHHPAAVLIAGDLMKPRRQLPAASAAESKSFPASSPSSSSTTSTVGVNRCHNVGRDNVRIGHSAGFPVKLHYDSLHYTHTV